MDINRIIPMISANDLEKVKHFYTHILNFKVAFEGKGYLGLKAQGSSSPEISFMIPEEGQPTYSGAGLTYCLLVDDVDKEYERLSKRDITVARPLQDNPWGDRSFVISDPLGIFLYLYQEIAATDEYKQYIIE